ncbi:MAG: Threonylcarbamoyl-AMP synthase [Chlamydiia bacterium]|nr:Threonylcarbamoyl-AMP synthase [Chlamydiia bacterium]
MNAIDILKNDEVIIHPTDTVYGISGLYSSEIAYKKIYSIKNRSFNKPLGVLISSLSQIPTFTDVALDEIKTVIPFLNQGMTILLKLKQSAPSHLKKQSDFIGLRIPQHPETQNLINITGPLICTSANLSGENPITSKDEARKFFQGVFILNGESPKSHTPSTIIKYEDGKYTLIREGHIQINDYKCLF